MSSFNIVDIKSIHPESKKYFFDANVWIIILQSPSELNAEEKCYIDFFDALSNLSSTLKAKKADAIVPTIVVSPLLISEIFNTYTRIAFRKWKDELRVIGKLSTEEINKKDYKRDYRKESHYDLAVKQFTSDFLAHKGIITLMEDVNKVDPFYILKNFPANTDFNDQYYYNFCYEHKIPIVTHDGDFIQPSIEIITNHRLILKHK